LENTFIVRKFPESQDTPLILVKMVRYNAAVFLTPADITMQSSETGLPSGWEVRHSQSKGLPYYFNPTTAESRWEPPDGSNVETLNTYIGKYHSSVSVRISDNATDGKIRASHLLVKHRDSRRPSSWKETNITRTKEEAINLLKGYEEQIKSGKKSLGELARSESDDSSARKNGDLGFFGKNMMQKEFENAAFALKPGEVSGIVETASGVHLIERIQ
jgi:NIMA-interacting peptidyl-prolyl cis-trans isomerase 1